MLWLATLEHGASRGLSELGDSEAGTVNTDHRSADPNLFTMFDVREGVVHIVFSSILQSVREKLS